MKRNYLKFITLIIAVALVLTLACGLFVACGETDGGTDPSIDKTEDLGGAPSTGAPETGAPETGAPDTGASDVGPSGTENPAPGNGGSSVPELSDPVGELKDGKITASQYFDKFNQLSSSVGSAAIAKGADIYYHSELSGTFGLRPEFGKGGKSFDFGVEIESILDRTSTDENGEYTSERSAIRARLFSGDVSIIGVTYFVIDPMSLYIDFAGSHIKLSAEFVYEGTNLNELLGRFIGKALSKEFDFDFGEWDFSISINKILDAIVDGMGGDWSPTVLLKSLASLIGIDAQTPDIPGMDELSSSLLQDLLARTFNATKDGNNYSIILDTRDTGWMLHALFSELLGVELQFKMNFTDDNGRLADGVSFEFGLPELLTDEEFYPYVGLRVNALELAPVDGKQIKMDAPKEEYTGNIAFKTEESLSPEGFKLFGSEVRGFSLSKAFMLDFVNPLATNRTAAQIRLTFGDDVLFDVSFVRGRLAIRLAPQIIFKEGTLIGDACRNVLDFVLDKLKQIDPDLETTVADAIYVGGAAGPREQIDENFKGVAVDSIPIREILDSLVAEAVDFYREMPEMPELPDMPELPEENPDGSLQMPDLSELLKYTPANIMRYRILPAIGEIVSTIVELDDGKINVHSDNILQLLLNISNDLLGLVGEDRMSYEELIDEAIDGAASVLDWLAEHGVITYDKQTPDAITLMDNCFKALLDNFSIEGAPQQREGESFTKYALRLLIGATSVDFTLDLTDGWRYSVGFGISEATITYSYSFSVWEGLEVDDLYDNTENGWLMFDFTDLENFIK